MTRNAATAYSRPATSRATLTAYEANVMDALCREALEHGLNTTLADMLEDAAQGDADQLKIAAKAGRAVVNRYTATATERRNADTWNALMRGAYCATH